MLAVHIGIKWPAKVLKGRLVIKVFKEVKVHLVERVNKVYKVFKVI
jgi:hypothetical protein